MGDTPPLLSITGSLCGAVCLQSWKQGFFAFVASPRRFVCDASPTEAYWRCLAPCGCFLRCAAFRFVRMYAKRRAAMLRKLRDVDARDARCHSAAIIIQCAYRQHAARHTRAVMMRSHLYYAAVKLQVCCVL